MIGVQDGPVSEWQWLMPECCSVRLLVTGGAGFIGSNFIRHWLSKHPDDEIINLDALTYAGDLRNLEDVSRTHPARHTFVRGDIADPDSVLRLVKEHRPQVVVNFAAESHNSRAVLEPARFVHTNVLGTHSLLEAARAMRVERFHHVSTCEVYGELSLGSIGAFREEDPYRPRTPYSASKAAADLLVRAYHETYGLPITISNACNNFGPWQHPEKAVPQFATRALDGLPLPLYEHSHYRREWMHVEDHCRALELVVLRGKPGETYNVGTGEERSVEEIADAILRVIGAPSSLKRYVSERPGHDQRYLLDHTKIATELGWRPQVSFADGLRDTVAWYRDNRWWWGPKRERMELDEFAWLEEARTSRQ